MIWLVKYEFKLYFHLCGHLLKKKSFKRLIEKNHFLNVRSPDRNPVLPPFDKPHK